MFSSIRKIVGRMSLAAVLMTLGFASVSSATTLDGVLVAGDLNTFEDTSREAFVDVDGDGTFNVGDVLVGFVRIENTATGTDLGDTTYAIFSQQVATINTTTGVVTFEATTVAGLTMPELVDGASAGSMVAIVTNPAGFGDLITTEPVANATLEDYFAVLTGPGSFLELTAGIVDTTAGGDFFNATIDAAAAFVGCDIDIGDPLVVTTDCIVGLSESVTIATFTAGLSIIDNNTSFDYADNVIAAGNGDATLAQFAITAGNSSGANETTPDGFKDASTLTTEDQCGDAGDVPCGFRDNADFSVRPLAVVPEPASMILFGLGLAGLGVYGRRSHKKSE